jgi:hypothetical protein
MAGTDRLYPPIEPYDLEPPQVLAAAAAGSGEEEEAGVCDAPVMWDDEPDASPSPEAVIEHSLLDSSDTEFASPVEWNIRVLVSS